jgi:GntR family transcriptional regulator, transcriptional repressor for pyruvate dehydrogenase complex
MLNQSQLRPTRAEAVKRDLIDRIRAGAIRPGERLPAERALAAELGVSRNVVREAIGGLSAINVLETRPGSGVYVSDFDVASLVEPVEFAVLLGPSHIRSVIQARMVTEPGIAALAAQFGTPEQIDGLYRLIERSRTMIDEPEAYIDLDMQIHDAIVRMAGNPILSRICDALRRLVQTSREMTNTGAELREGALAGHQEIFEAIASRDPERAATAMHDHLQFVDDHLFDYKVTPRAT